MNNLLFIDTETTGKGPDDRLLQVAFAEAEADTTGLTFLIRDPSGEVKSRTNSIAIYSAYYKPPVEIMLDAMAVHHITPEMVADKVPFCESDFKPMLAKLADDGVLVAHNAPFDLAMLDKEGIKFPRWIDTLRVARHLLDSPNYQLQYLRYSLGIYKNLNNSLPAHDAAADVNALIGLFMHLAAIMINNGMTPDETINHFIFLSKQPVEIKTLNFGKYSGQTIEEIGRKDAGYLDWLYNAESRKTEHEQNKDLIHTLIIWQSNQSKKSI